MKANRSPEEISLFNPLSCGDTIQLGRTVWTVGRGAHGWKLHAPANCTWVHPEIKDVDGMADFIGAIIEKAQ